MAYLNLYPPVVDTYMPAFTVTENCRIYFSLSPYNNIADIKYAQVSIVYQQSNLSALSKDYKNDIKVCKIQIDNNVTNSNKKYYIQIDAQDLTNGFTINTYYKVQIRFTHKDAANLPSMAGYNNTYQETAAWLMQNAQYFSEWSTVCLIRAISVPNIEVADYIKDNGNFTSRTLHVLGKLSFADSSETEILSMYQLFLKDADNNIIEQSDKIYTDILNPNAIDYTMKSLLQKNSRYSLIVRYVTRNLYENEQTFMLTTSSGTAINFQDLKITTSADSELGVNTVLINFNKFAQQDADELWIKRSSIKDGFNKWEYVHRLVNNNYVQLEYLWKDFTVESGVWYKYALEVNRNNSIIDMTLCEEPAIVILDNMSLMRDYRQLSITFNPQVSAFQKVVSDTITTTLGSQYPFVNRNGNSNYRQFNIGGLISSHMDIGNTFTNKNEIYNVNKDLYEQFNKDNRISEYKDYQYEFEFRERVMDFLYDGQPKLYRSPTEGNILVKLTNISLTPNQTLGRLLYTFTATAVEIGECSSENLMKYGVLKSDTETDILQDGIFTMYEHEEKTNTTVIPPYSLEDDMLVITTYSNGI